MHIFVVCSKQFYDRVPALKAALESQGHSVTLPNGYDAPGQETSFADAGEYAAWKASMLRQDREIVAAHDAVLVVNNEKNGQKNYIGGAVFLEIANAFYLDKKIYLMNPIPDAAFKDELIGMQPTIINGDLRSIGTERR